MNVLIDNNEKENHIYEEGYKKKTSNMITKQQQQEEDVNDKVLIVDNNDENDVSNDIKDAQKVAEEEVAQLESNNDNKEEENSINVIPRLLQGAPDVNQLVEKTKEYKAKGQQLDLLLLKAETYSHFIRENQERSKKKLNNGSHFSCQDEDENEDTPSKGNSSKKRKKTTISKSKSSKVVKGKNGSPLPSSMEDDPDDTFRVTKTLVGGTLMNYQKEGLKWLLSLWENGLSGILADEM